MYLIRFKKAISKPVHKLIYLFSGCFPRNKNIWLFGAQKNSFLCNSKHLFLYVTQSHPEILAVWVSSDKCLVRELNKQGLEAVYAKSMKGVYLKLRASTYFVNSSTKDVGFWLSKGTVFVNLWHGIPLKKIQKDDDRSNKPKISLSEIFLSKLFFPKLSFQYSYIVSPSEYIVDYSFATAFNLEKDRFISVGSPRTDIFFNDAINNKYLNKNITSLKSFISDYDKSFLYAPTWRDGGIDFIKQSGLDFGRLNEALSQLNSCLLLKLHPHTKIELSELYQYQNIKVLDSSYDLYDVCPMIDFLITDYSSIYFDFLLLDRPIIFFAFDLDYYLLDCRDLYFNYHDVTPGVKALEFNYLLTCMRDCVTGEDNYHQERLELKEQFWGEYDGNASQEIVSFLKNKTKELT